MQNAFLGMFPCSVYDLKGSEVNRLASPSDNTGLDTNFIINRDGVPYLLAEERYIKLMHSLE